MEKNPQSEHPNIHLVSGFAECQRQHFLATPVDSEVTEGQSAVLGCRVGNQIGQVQWTKDGLTLGESLSFSLELIRIWFIIMNTAAAPMSDKATKCWAFVVLNSVTEQNTLITPKKMNNERIKSSVVQVLTDTCRALIATSSLAMILTADSIFRCGDIFCDTSLDNIEDACMVNSFIYPWLQVVNATKGDEAKYECQVGPGRGNPPIRASAFLTVNCKQILICINSGSGPDDESKLQGSSWITTQIFSVPPTNIQILNHLSGSRIEVKENEEIEIACKVSNAKPKARISWFRNNVAFNPGLGKLKSQDEFDFSKSSKSELDLALVMLSYWNKTPWRNKIQIVPIISQALVNFGLVLNFLCHSWLKFKLGRFSWNVFNASYWVWVESLNHFFANL